MDATRATCHGVTPRVLLMIAAVTRRESPGRNGKSTPDSMKISSARSGEDVRAECVQHGCCVEQAHGERNSVEHEGLSRAEGLVPPAFKSAVGPVDGQTVSRLRCAGSSRRMRITR